MIQKNTFKIGSIYTYGKKEGVYKSYYKDGQLYEEANYIDGKKV
jgi:hypothetical protein